MIFLWLLAGAVLVTAAFFLPGRSVELWPNINSAGIALLAYLAVLTVSFLRRSDLTARRRYVVLGVILIALGGTFFSWRQMDRTSHWQRQTLGEIGSIIGRGIYQAMVPDSMLAVLEAYHQQGTRGKRSIGEVYRQTYPPARVGPAWSTLEPTGMPNAPDDVFLTEISDTHVVLVARHPWYWGNDTSFVNVAGLTGKLQVRATLTEKGLRYVTEN